MARVREGWALGGGSGWLGRSARRPRAPGGGFGSVWLGAPPPKERKTKQQLENPNTLETKERRRRGPRPRRRNHPQGPWAEYVRTRQTETPPSDQTEAHAVTRATDSRHQPPPSEGPRTRRRCPGRPFPCPRPTGSRPVPDRFRVRGRPVPDRYPTVSVSAADRFPSQERRSQRRSQRRIKRRKERRTQMPMCRAFHGH